MASSYSWNINAIKHESPTKAPPFKAEVLVTDQTDQ